MLAFQNVLHILPNCKDQKRIDEIHLSVWFGSVCIFVNNSKKDPI